jgi:NADPH2:quinone reductase
VYEDIPAPVAGPNEVLIKVEAVGMNFSDVLRRRGDNYPMPSPTPFIPGSEVAGTIAAIGQGVSGMALGSMVYATPRAGGYAQYVVVPADAVIPVPEGITAPQATALVIQGLTAAFALRDAGRLAAGESVLIEAAAGGVGSFAVQLARLSGAGTIIAAASSEDKRRLALELGADHAVDYTASNWPSQVRELTGGRGADIILEMTGGDTVGQALDALADFGRMVVYGQASGKVALVDPQRLTVPNHSVTGFYIGAYFRRPELIKQALNEIVGHVVAGRLKVQLGAVLPLSQAQEAHRLLEGRHSTGKLVLQPWAD